MQKILLVGAILALAGCAQTGKPDQITSVLDQIANTSTADLKTSIAVANAATPPDADGAACAQAVLTVSASMQKVLAASTAAGGTIGAFTVAEIASLYQPGSAQYNYAIKTVGTGCLNKAVDVAGQTANAVISAVPAVVALAPVK